MFRELFEEELNIKNIGTEKQRKALYKIEKNGGGPIYSINPRAKFKIYKKSDIKKIAKDNVDNKLLIGVNKNGIMKIAIGYNEFNGDKKVYFIITLDENGKDISDNWAYSQSVTDLIKDFSYIKNILVSEDGVIVKNMPKSYGKVQM